MINSSCHRGVFVRLSLCTPVYTCSIVAALMIPQLPSVIFVWCLLWGSCGWILWSFCEQSFKEIRCWNPSITHNIRPECRIDYKFMFSFFLCVCVMWCVGARMHTHSPSPHAYTHSRPAVLWDGATAKTTLVCVKGAFDDKPWLRTDGTLAG